MNYDKNDVRLRDMIIRNSLNQSSKSYIDKVGEDRIYYNVSIAHNDALSINGSPTQASFTEVRSEELFTGNPKDYSLSVVRFTIPTGLIPLLVFPVIENPGNPADRNFGQYAVSLVYNNVVFKSNLIYIPQDNTASVPSSLPNNTKLTENELLYYSIYSIQWFLDILNSALKSSFDALKIAFPAVTPTQPPFFRYEPSTKLFSLIAQTGYDSTQVNYIKICLNTYVYELFSNSFNVVFNGYSNATTADATNIQFIVRSNGENFSNIPVFGNIYKMTQDYPTISQWYPFESIIFTSGSLPLRYEWISGGNTLQQAQGTNGVQSENFRRILTDFEIDINDFEIRSYIHYFPTAEYRRIDMLGNLPIKNIDIQVWWKDNYDNLYPILIPAHDVLTIKMLFERKK